MWLPNVASSQALFRGPARAVEFRVLRVFRQEPHTETLSSFRAVGRYVIDRNIRENRQHRPHCNAAENKSAQHPGPQRADISLHPTLP